MAKLTDLPDDVLFVIADMLRHREMTLDEAFAQAHKDDSVDSDRAIGSFLLRGFDDVLNLSLVHRRFQSVMRRAYHSISFTGRNATLRMISFLMLLDKYPEIKGWVRTIYLNLEQSQPTNHYFNETSVAFLCQQALKKGVTWSEAAWLRADQGWHGHRIETIALILLANLPNLQELGLALSAGEPIAKTALVRAEGTPIASRSSDLGETSDTQSPTLCPKLTSLALRPANNTVPIFPGLYSIIGKIGAEPTRLYIDDLYPVRMGLESAGLCRTLFGKVTHLTIAGTVSGLDYRDAFDYVMKYCGPLVDFRLIGHSNDPEAAMNSDSIIDALHILKGLRKGKRHTKTLRTLVIDLSENWDYCSKSGVDYLNKFEKLENLWVDGDSLCLVEPSVMAGYEEGYTLNYFDALDWLPRSLKKICFAHQLEFVADVLIQFAGDLGHLTNLERVCLKDLHADDNTMEDLKRGFEGFGVQATITEVDPILWEAS